MTKIGGEQTIVKNEGLLTLTGLAQPASADRNPARPAAGHALPPQLLRLSTRVRMRRGLSLLAVLADVGTLLVAYLGAGLIRFGDPLHGQVLNMLGVLLPVYFGIAFNNRCFNLGPVARPRIGVWNAISAFLITLCVVGLVVFFLKVSADFSRAVFATGAAFVLLLMPPARYTLARVAARMFETTLLNQVVIEDGVRVKGSDAIVLDAERHGLAPQLDDPAMLDRLGRCLRFADRVVVACLPERRALWATALRGADVNAEVLATELDDLGAIGLSRFGGRSTLLVAASPLDVIDRLMKRALDLGFVLLAMIVALPAMLVIGIAIKIDSPGPILFGQSRVGLGNRIFKMYKFRSMYADRADGLGDRSARRGDERVTRVGRFLRASSLDELPQLFNVLSGAMSVVGPRPHPLLCKAEDRLFWEIDLTYWHRHAVKPGMTGLAQVRGFRGATETTLDLTNRLQADLEYLAGWTIWRDIGIIFATFRVLVHRNAF